MERSRESSTMIIDFGDEMISDFCTLGVVVEKSNAVGNKTEGDSCDCHG